MSKTYTVFSKRRKRRLKWPHICLEFNSCRPYYWCSHISVLPSKSPDFLSTILNHIWSSIEKSMTFINSLQCLNSTVAQSWALKSPVEKCGKHQSIPRDVLLWKVCPQIQHHSLGSIVQITSAASRTVCPLPFLQEYFRLDWFWLSNLLMNSNL